VDYKDEHRRDSDLPSGERNASGERTVRISPRLPISNFRMYCHSEVRQFPKTSFVRMQAYRSFKMRGAAAMFICSTR
jgi:hypothetical protein